MKTDKHLKTLWNYCASLYEKEGVKEACLSLQDRHGADVILILFICWHWSERGRVLGKRDICFLTERSRAWQRDVISSIRMTRRQIGKSDELAQRRIYRSLKASELEAEKQELVILIEALDELSKGTDQTDTSQKGKPEDLMAGLLIYFECLGVLLKPKDRQQLAILAGADRLATAAS